MNKVVLITGSAKGIGKCTKELFLSKGDIVCGIDRLEGEYMQGDISDPQVLERYVSQVIQDYGHIDVIVNNAKPPMYGIDEGSFEMFMNALSIGVGAPYYLVKLSLPYLNKNASIINISSSRDNQSQSQSESYTAAKGGINALTHALSVSLRGKARVNSISPGWIDTRDSSFSNADISQHPANKVGKPEDIAEMVYYLSGDKASFITGENIRIDGGMSRLMIYHDDEGWTYNG